MEKHFRVLLCDERGKGELRFKTNEEDIVEPWKSESQCNEEDGFLENEEI